MVVLLCVEYWWSHLSKLCNLTTTQLSSTIILWLNMTHTVHSSCFHTPMWPQFNPRSTCLWAQESQHRSVIQSHDPSSVMEVSKTDYKPFLWRIPMFFKDIWSHHLGCFAEMILWVFGIQIYCCCCFSLYWKHFPGWAGIGIEACFRTSAEVTNGSKVGLHGALDRLICKASCHDRAPLPAKPASCRLMRLMLAQMTTPWGSQTDTSATDCYSSLLVAGG